jgi:hypothetical protein
LRADAPEEHDRSNPVAKGGDEGNGRMGDDDIRLELYDADADPEVVDRDTRALREELLSIDAVDSVSAATAGPAPEGTRGLELAAIGALIVQAQPTAELVTHVIGVIRRWLSAGSHEAHERTLRLTVNGQVLELADPTATQQQELVDQFIQTVGAH